MGGAESERARGHKKGHIMISQPEYYNNGEVRTIYVELYTYTCVFKGEEGNIAFYGRTNPTTHIREENLSVIKVCPPPGIHFTCYNGDRPKIYALIWAEPSQLEVAAARGGNIQPCLPSFPPLSFLLAVPRSKKERL